MSLRVHYERFLLAESFTEALAKAGKEITIMEALRWMFGDEDLTLPEKNMEQEMRFHLKKRWNERRRETGGGLPAASPLHHMFAVVDG